jgi:leucyl/phenylalanyl-tRNA--protein transferase
MKQPNVQMLLAAYAQGIFPMSHPEVGDEVYWYAPDPRAIIPLDERFIVSRRLRQVIRQGRFEVRYSTAFSDVMEACAAPREVQKTTWISAGLVRAYTQLHQLGFAHSVEAWRDGQLVGGLYGVSLGGLFAGESMFHRETDASKVCLVALVERLRERGYQLLDTQFTTDHLKKFGAYEIPRDEYERRLEGAVGLSCSFL